MVRKWSFKDGHTNIQDEELSDRPSVITDDLIQKVDCTETENIRLKISSFAAELLFFYEIVIDHLKLSAIAFTLSEEHNSAKNENWCHKLFHCSFLKLS